MQKVDGYLTNDDQFFRTAEEAELHEARQELQDAALAHGVDPDRLCVIISYIRPAVRRFIDAQDANIVAEPDSPEWTRTEDQKWTRTEDQTRLDRVDPPEPKGSPDTLQQQPARRRKPMPDLGRRERPEEI